MCHTRVPYLFPFLSVFIHSTLPPFQEPTVRMSISVNKSPLAGREGKLLQSRVIRDRLFKELDRNVALKVSETDSADTYEGNKPL